MVNSIAVHLSCDCVSSVETAVTDSSLLVLSSACETCGARFGRKASLNQHHATVHERKRPFQCEVCLKSFGQKVCGSPFLCAATSHL
jgi:hypothetical protein